MGPSACSCSTSPSLSLGARVIGTASEGNHGYLRELGAQPVAYGDGWSSGSAPWHPAG